MAIMARMPGGPPEWQLGLNVCFSNVNNRAQRANEHSKQVRMMQDIDESYLETEL